MAHLESRVSNFEGIFRVWDFRPKTRDLKLFFEILMRDFKFSDAISKL